VLFDSFISSFRSLFYVAFVLKLVDIVKRHYLVVQIDRFNDYSSLFTVAGQNNHLTKLNVILNRRQWFKPKHSDLVRFETDLASCLFLLSEVYCTHHRGTDSTLMAAPGLLPLLVLLPGTVFRTLSAVRTPPKLLSGACYRHFCSYGTVASSILGGFACDSLYKSTH